MKKHRQHSGNIIVRLCRRLFISLRRNPAPANLRPAERRRVPINRKAIPAIAGTVAVAAIAVVLVTSLGGQASGGDLTSPDSLADGADPAAEIPEPEVSLAMPVYAPISISEGMEAAVVAEIQARLIELDYLDGDEPGTVYEESTRAAVVQFQAQHGLGAAGTVDQQTYDMLLSDQAQHFTIAIEAEGDMVSELQQRLYELGYIDTVTGYFGEETLAAVAKFQKLNGLTEDGKVDKHTREMLYDPNAVPNMYTFGEQSPEILACQQRLKELGYLTTEPDGNFGEDTKAAVRRFQESNGLVVDGNIGPTTREALMSENAHGNALSIGAEGEDVLRVQKRLQALGYMNKATGYYGELTDRAVRNFQRANGLSVDGKIGRQTMNLLTSDKAKKYQPPAVSRGSSGSSAPSQGASSANVTGANVESFISVAESKIGCKYKRTAKGPDTFDCSGFVYWCLQQVGVNSGYMTSSAWASCTKFTRINSMSEAQRGDIIVYSGHVAIYAGNGVVIDASNSNGSVVRRGCTSPWFSKNFICAYRVF